MDARMRWAIAFGTLDTALFVGVLALMGLPAFDDPSPGVAAYFALLWALAIGGSWWALRYAPRVPEIDSGSAVALVVMGPVVGALLGVITIFVLAVASDTGEWAFAAFASVFAVFYGGVIGLLAALVNVGVLLLARVAGMRRDEARG